MKFLNKALCITALFVLSSLSAKRIGIQNQPSSVAIQQAQSTPRIFKSKLSSLVFPTDTMFSNQYRMSLYNYTKELVRMNEDLIKNMLFNTNDQKTYTLAPKAGAEKLIAALVANIKSKKGYFYALDGKIQSELLMAIVDRIPLAPETTEAEVRAFIHKALGGTEELTQTAQPNEPTSIPTQQEVQSTPRVFKSKLSSLVFPTDTMFNNQYRMSLYNYTNELVKMNEDLIKNMLFNTNDQKTYTLAPKAGAEKLIAALVANIKSKKGYFYALDGKIQSELLMAIVDRIPLAPETTEAQVRAFMHKALG